VHGSHTIKLGGEWLHSVNTQVFRGFFNGRYIFGAFGGPADVLGFLHYASPASLGPGFGPTTIGMLDGTTFTNSCRILPGGNGKQPSLSLYPARARHRQVRQTINPVSPRLQTTSTHYSFRIRGSH